VRAVKELNDFKVKAQEIIRGLQQRVKETAAQNEKLTKDYKKEKEMWEKDLEKTKKEVEKLQTRSQKDSDELRAQYEEQIAGLTDNLEMVTLDREIAEEKAESLEQEVEQLKAKLQTLEINQQPPQAPPVQQQPQQDNSTASNEGAAQDVQALVTQNEKLKEALMKLRDLSLGEKQEREKRIKELERENKTLQPLPGTNGLCVCVCMCVCVCATDPHTISHICFAFEQ
jgi:dynactin 1